MIDISNALLSLKPNAQWVLRDDELEWLDTEQTQPTEAEIQAELTRLQADYDSKQYARDRAADYPSIADQLDTLYHGGIDAWKAEVKVVKDKYPKGV
jgi:hypothetical protein